MIYYRYTLQMIIKCYNQAIKSLKGIKSDEYIQKLISA